MHESTLDLFEDYADDEAAYSFSEECDTKAAEYGVSVTYYLLEFI
jgi:hypothetical protein